MVASRACRVAVLATHPIHYQIQLVRRLAEVPGMDATMLFCSRFGLGHAIDPTFGLAVQWYDESVLEGVKHKFLPHPLWERGPKSVCPTISPSIVPELGRHAYDVLLVQGYAGVTEWMAMAAAKAGACRVLFRGETGLNPRSSRRNRATRWVAMKALARFVDVFLPIGTRSREFYLRYGIAPERLVQTPYAVDNDFFFARAHALSGRRSELRATLGIPGDIPVVLCVSKMVPRKRPLDLLRAFARLQERAFLLFVGDGPLRKEMEDYVSAHNVGNVLLAGFQGQEALSRFYAVGDVFALPSDYEPWGLVVNEAMCFSLPIITTRGVAASADLVTGKNGFVYEAGDIEALHAALRDLVREPRRRAEMGRESRTMIQGWDQPAAVKGMCQGIARARGGVTDAALRIKES
jgi:glycosyltransferase involved in cell wall biosynthesis